MTLRDFFRIMRERWRTVALSLTFVLGIAVLITWSTSRMYQASTPIYIASNAVADPNSQYGGVIASQTQAATFAEIANSKPVLDLVISDLNLRQSFSELAPKVTATAPSQRSLVTITVTDSSADEAARIANSVARAFVTVVQKDNTPDGSSKPTFKLSQVSPATAPSSPSQPRPLLNISVGLLLGLLGGMALAVVRDVLDRRIKQAETLERVAGRPAMGVVIEDSKAARHPIATRAGVRNQRAENFRQLRANLQFANVDNHPRIIAVTSSIPGEGKSMVAINLASMLAEAGFSVCLVDADLRRPTVAKVLGMPGAVGLTSVLINQIDLNEALQDAGSNLLVLSSGPTPPNPAEVLASSYMRDVVHSLLARVDYVIIDTAPVLPVADGAEVAALADGTLFVARHNVTTEPQVKRAIAALGRLDARVVGVVLNRVPAGRRGEYGYTYYRAEQPSRPSKGEPVKREPGARSKRVQESVGPRS